MSVPSVIAFAQLRVVYDRAPSMWSTVSADAGRVASVGETMTAIGTLILLLVIAIGGWGLWRRRTGAQNDLPLPPLPANENRWVLGGGLLMPVVVLTIMFVLTLPTLRDSPAAAAADAPADIIVIGHQWWWEVRYPVDSIVAADEMHIPVDRPVRVALRSADVIHSFWTPNVAGKTDLIPGQDNTTVLEADSAGVYRETCAGYCGAQHAHMAMSVIAESPECYARWLASARAPGLAAFQQHSCARCHAIAGTSAVGAIGPNLTHFGSRRTLASGMFPNTP